MTSTEYAKRTQLILEKTIISLLLDEKKTFVWESLFFLDEFLTKQGGRSICAPLKSRMTMTSSSKTTLEDKYHCISFQDSVLLLLEKKQFELVGGGWISYDEALTDFSSALSDMSLGRSWIVEAFGMQ